jgi:glycosyltransferase involved in cell wall biosynthesis
VKPASPLVSVVMPSLDQRRFIAAAIDSVLGQDHTTIELIVADGASTDGTVEYLAERSAADPRLRWSSQKDGGPAEALDRALAQVRGTIVGWLNSDDLYAPGAVSRAVAAFAAHPDWIMHYGNGRHVDAEGGDLGPYPTLPPEGPIERFSNGCFICQPTVFFKKTMYVLLGDLDRNLRAAFDYDYWVRAFAAFPGRIGFVDAVQAMSRLHDECITVKMRRRVATEAVKVVARHFGEAPSHWLTTYIEEVLALPREARGSADLRGDLLALLSEVRDLIDPAAYSMLAGSIRTDRRFD